MRPSPDTSRQVAGCLLLAATLPAGSVLAGAGVLGLCTLVWLARSTRHHGS